MYNLRKQDNVHEMMLLYYHIDNPKWFYTKDTPEKMMNKMALYHCDHEFTGPRQEYMVLQILAYKPKARIPQCTKDW